MPDLDWNKTVWKQEIEQANTGEITYFGSQWGDPHAKNHFPFFIRPFLSDRKAHELLRKPRVQSFLKRIGSMKDIYWPFFKPFIDKYIDGYVHSDMHVLEIGVGGGRWTKFLLRAKHVTAVDINPDLIEYTKKRLRTDELSRVTFYQTEGSELEGIESDSIDLVFTFDVFVHLEPTIISDYLKEIQRVLKPGAKAIVHYANKEKTAAQKSWFSDMTPGRFEEMIQSLDAMQLIDSDDELVSHSTISVIEKVSND